MGRLSYIIQVNLSHCNRRWLSEGEAEGALRTEVEVGMLWWGKEVVRI